MEQFIYTSKHMGALKKYNFMKTLFVLLGCLVVLLQSIAWLVVWMRDMATSTSDMFFVGITLISALYFTMSQVFFLARNNKIIKIVSSGNQFITSRVKMKFSNKSSFAGALVVLCKILAVLFVILLGIVIVSFVQNYVNWGKVILKMPFMVFCAIGFLNLSAELSYQKMLEKA